MRGCPSGQVQGHLQARAPVQGHQVPQHAQLPQAQAGRPPRAREQHIAWESVLEETPRNILHYSLTGPPLKHGMPADGGVPDRRLLPQAARRARDAGAEHHQGQRRRRQGLMTPEPGTNDAVFNLHVLDARPCGACTVSRPTRPAENPRRPRAAQAARRAAAAAAARRGGKLIKRKPVAEKGPLAPVCQIIEEDIVWACCDKCDKWRSIPGVLDESEPPRRGTARCTRTTSPATGDQMDTDEKWSGDTTGVIRAGPVPDASGKASAVASEDESEEEASSSQEPPARWRSPRRASSPCRARSARTTPSTTSLGRTTTTMATMTLRPFALSSARSEAHRHRQYRHGHEWCVVTGIQ